MLGGMSGSKLGLGFWGLFTALLLAQGVPDPALDAARSAYQAGNVSEAQARLTGILQGHPNDWRALVLMGAVLDAQQKFRDAEPYYERALRIAPDSPQALNNAANHYLAAGDRGRARELYRRTVAADPTHPNANLQLAQMCVDEHQGRQALEYLGRVSGADAADSGVLLLRARALALSGRCTESSRILERFRNAGDGAALLFSVGLAQAECRRYPAAEESFSRALAAEPRNFDILYNLGWAALRAGHSDRAESVLGAALREKPDDPDALYALAEVWEARNQPVKAVALLARAEKLAPQRPDLPLLLAQISARLGFDEDAASAYDRYLALKPGDDAARRERGFAKARMNQTAAALRDLEWYVTRHPRDGTGYFELAVAQLFQDRKQAVTLLNKALALDPALYQARYTRALLSIEDDRAAAAIPDLEQYLAKAPADYRALAHLGEAYLAVDRAADALPVLERANSLAPDSALVLLYYRRALQRLGRAREAAAVLARLREAGKWEDQARRRVGLLEYVNLSPADQRARYLANLRQTSAADPGNARLRLSLARELLSEGRQQEALEALRAVAGMPAEPAILAGCGRLLLEAGRYQEARDVLQRVLSADASLSEARLDLVIAVFRLGNKNGALRELDQTSAADRKGDYYLLRAQILDAQGQVAEAAAALNQGIRAAPTRASLYEQATAFLFQHKLYHEALDLLQQASRMLPDDRDLLLSQAVALEVLRRDQEGEKLLARIQARWPEWDRPYLLKGVLREIQLRSAEARQALETAIALGARTPEAYYYEALAITRAAPNDLEAAQDAINHALALTTRDPAIHLLAGKISLARQEYSAAVGHLLDATRLQPSLIPAHYALRDAYRALGEQEKSREELETIKRISARTGGEGAGAESVDDLLFTVRAPE